MTEEFRINISASDNTNTAFASAERRLAGLTAAASTASTVLSTLGVAAGASAFVGFIKTSIDAADSLNDLSQKTGISVTSLGGLQITADQSGTSLDTLAKGVKELSIFMVEAADGNKQNAATLKALGVTAKEPEQALIQLANAFEKMQDGPRKTKLANDILKKSGQDMIPVLNNGGDALQRNLDLFKQLNPNIEQLARQSDQFNDQMVALKASSTAFGNAAAANLLPVLNSILKTTIDTTRESGLLAGTWAGMKGLFSNIFSDAGSPREQQIAGRLDEIRDSMDGILARRKQWFVSSDFAERDLQALNKEAIALQKELVLLQQTNAAKAAAKDKGGTLNLPNTDGDDQRRRAAESAARANSQAILSAQERLQASKNLSQVEQVTFDIEQGKYAGLTSATKQRLLEIYAEIDSVTALQKAEKDHQDAIKTASEEGISRFKALQQAGVAVYESTLTSGQRYEAEVLKLNDLLAQGAITQETYNAALINTQTEYQNTANKAGVAGQEMSQFAIQAARSTQTAFAQFLFDPFDDGLKGMALGFVNTVRMMAAEAASAQLMETLFGGIGGGGKKGGGVLGELLGGVAKGLFGFLGFADGGDFGGGLRLVGERGPELEVTGPSRIFNANQTKQILSGGGSGDTINVNLHIQTGVQQTVRAEFISLIPEIRRQAVVAVADAKRRRSPLLDQ